MRVTDAAFTEAILSMRETLYRVSYGMLREEQDRRDAVQEALARGWAKRHTLREADHVRTWMVRILINECQNIRRRQQRMLPAEHLPENAMPEGADPDLHNALLALPEGYRLPIMLHYMEGYAIAEIARILRLPMGTVATRMRRGRAKLRDDLIDDEEV